MTCETCERDFPDSCAKVWNGKRVCPDCFQTLAPLPAITSESKFAMHPAEASFRINPAAYIDVYISGSDAPWLANVTSDVRTLARMASESGKRELSSGEVKAWGAFLITNIKAHIASTLAEDLDMRITDAQAFTIAANYLSGVHSASGARLEPEFCITVPLTEEERRVAEEIGYYAWKAFAVHQRYLLTDENLRALTGQAIALGENRLDGVWHKSWRGGWRLPLKSACDGAQQMARDRAYNANARAVSNCMSFAGVISELYSQHGVSFLNQL